MKEPIHDFGITFKGDIDPKRTVALCKQAEVAGFKYGWFFDSHVLWRECYLTMALCMAHTDDMIFGPLVTNPGVREWSVAGSMYASARGPKAATALRSASEGVIVRGACWARSR